MSTTTRYGARFEEATMEEPPSWTAGGALGLRLVMGWVFLTAGLGKLLGEFSAAGYLANVDPASPMAGVYGAMAANPTLMDLVNVAVPWGQVLIGIGLLVGGLVRLAAFFGALQMAAFYFGNWEVANGLVNSDVVYLVVFFAIGALAAGRVYGIDAILERYEVDGESLIERHPRLRYVLG